MKAIEINNLCKNYGNVPVLNGTTLSINAGEITSLLGPNGAGKTTLIRILCGLTHYTNGSVKINNEEVKEKTKDSFKDVGYVGQSVNLDNTMSIIDNLHFQASLYGLCKNAVKEDIDEMLELFDLNNVRDKNVQRLSGGQRRSVDLIMGMIHKPKIIILDEPTINLDPDSRNKLWLALVKAQKQSKITILFSTHYLDEADKYSNRILFVNKGRLVASGTAEQLKSKIGNEVVIIEMKSKNFVNKANEIISQIDSAIDAKIAGSKIILTHPNISSLISKTIADLYNNNIDMERIMLSKPSLDEVYLMVAGESFTTAQTQALNQEQAMQQMFRRA